MKERKIVAKVNITFEGKVFQFLCYFWGDTIYSCGNARLIVNSDGSVYGTYRIDRKGIRLVF